MPPEVNGYHNNEFVPTAVAMCVVLYNFCEMHRDQCQSE